ncbi:MAG: OadG family protein [Clostridia bacterium]|nr:OadG family protein [Clostridia bacterium]
MTELSNTFVCIIGIGTVFIGLICIVLICKLISVVLNGFAKLEKEAAPLPQTQAVAAVPEVALSPAEKSAMVAGICACIAEELGTDASNIKVLSFKRV